MKTILTAIFVMQIIQWWYICAIWIDLMEWRGRDNMSHPSRNDLG